MEGNPLNIMTAWDFVISNWYYFVAGIILLPSALWAIFCIVWGGLISGWWDPEKLSEPLWKYRHFWRFCVKFDGVIYDWGWKGTLRKVGTLINLITFFWVWGYVGTLAFCLIGFCARWCWWAIKGFFGGLWKLISNAWNAL